MKNTITAFGLLSVIFLYGCQKQQIQEFTPGKEVIAYIPSIEIASSQYVWPEYDITTNQTTYNNISQTSLPSAMKTSPLFEVNMLPPTSQDSVAMSSKASVSFSNVWVLQFASTGQTVRCQNIGTVIAGGLIKTTLTSGSGYTIGIIANGPASGLSTDNVPNWEAFCNDLLFPQTDIQASAIPYSGYITSVKVLDNGQVEVDRQDAPTIPIRRIVAEISMQIVYDVDGFVLDGVTLHNVPTANALNYADNATLVPIGSAANFSYQDNSTEGLAPQSHSGDTYTWFIGDNRRGITTGITNVQDKNLSKAPQYTSYIRIKAHSVDEPHGIMTYDVFVGADMLNNFNIYRNHIYRYETRISGYSEAQLLLPAQDGRVTVQALTNNVTPDPAAIPVEGGTFTLTLTSATAWPSPIEVRAWDGTETLDKATINYQSGIQGGSAELIIPENTQETRRTIWFQYLLLNNWVNCAQLGYQTGSLVDIGATMLLEAQDPNYACTWEEAIQYCSEKGEGWRLPTSNELLFYWCITPALTSDEERFTTDRHYWSARKYENKSIVGFYTSNGQIHKNYAATSNEPGIGGTISREIMPTDKNYVRCVKPANRDNSYPKFEVAADGGVIVVLRDNNGGLDESTLFPNPLTQTLSGDEQSEDNRMSRRFRVQKTTNTQVTAKLQVRNLKNYCDTLTLDGYDNWRVPSQREMMLLFAIGASNYVQNGDADNTGVSSGQALVPTYLHQQEGMTPFETTSLYGGYIAATGVNIRQNEQRWTVYMGEYTSGASGYTADATTGFYTRCVRDEW